MWARLAERVMGIEPTLSAWKAEVLPLNYTRFLVTRNWNFEVCTNNPVSGIQNLKPLEGEGFEPSKA
jgi:hypothetical protein